MILTYSNKTIEDLKSYVRKTARRSAGSICHYDTLKMRNNRNKLKKEFKTLWNNKEQKLLNLKVGRLEVSENKIFYCAGQFAPNEIHLAVLEYFNKWDEILIEEDEKCMQLCNG